LKGENNVVGSENNHAKHYRSIEEVYPGLTILRLYDDQIIVFRVANTDYRLLDAWSDQVFSILESLPANQPYRALHDLSRPGIALAFSIKVGFSLQNVGVTKVGKERLDTFLAQRQDFTSYVALVFNNSFSGNLGQVHAKVDRTRNPNLQYRMFLDYEPAMDWLVSTLPSQPEPKQDTQADLQTKSHDIDEKHESA
jgi:hypothetical protein